jgi:peptidyl-prolyl cis-trans isomerase SurA
MKTLFQSIVCLFLLMGAHLVQAQKEIILTVENEQVTKEDFESIFRKNNRDSVITVQSLDEYMELFINFKLKVREAKDLGMDTVESFVRELDGYRRQLSRPYLTDSDLLDELIKQAYERKKTEVRASHILVKVDPTASPEDTLKAWEKITRLRKQITSGADFTTIAKSKAGSEDPSVQDNGGDLGYFSVFQMVYPFEEAAYTLKVGEVSQPVRTRYGYHLVKVTDRRQARGEVLVAHIMARVADPQVQEQVIEAEKKIREIHSQLLAGGDFADLALKYSDDKTTSRKGGELPWFGTGKMVQEFEEVSFNIATGAISEPFFTQYGWHIVKKLDSKDVPPFEDLQAELKSKVSRDTRADVTKKSFIDKLKLEYKFIEYADELKKVIKAADTSIFEGVIKINDKDLKNRMMAIDGQVYTVAEFVDYVGLRKQNRKMLPSEIVKQRYEEWVDEKILGYEDSRLELKHNAFRLLMNEYRDGILLFELTDQKVWSKAVKDTVGLEAFYASHKDQFMWPERAKVRIFQCENEKIAKKVRKLAKKKKSSDVIRAAFNKDSNLTVSVEEGLFTREDKEILRKMQWVKGVAEPVSMDNQTFIIDFQEVLAPQPKALDEARGLITAEYQNYLEKQWIDELRKKYKYQVNKAVLHSIK